MNNRRKFLQHTIAGGVLASVAPGTILATEHSEALPKSLAHKHLERLVNSHFMVIEESGRMTRLKLTDLLKSTADPSLDQFHLYFTATDKASLPELSYQVHHPSLGDQQLFLQPLGAGAQGPHYRATFSLKT